MQWSYVRIELRKSMEALPMLLTDCFCYLFITVFVCVCYTVSERETERERERDGLFDVPATH